MNFEIAEEIERLEEELYVIDKCLNHNDDTIEIKRLHNRKKEIEEKINELVSN